MQWTAGRPDGMTRRPNGWQGTEFSDLQTMHNLQETLLNSGIPVERHHYNEVILSNRMRPITNQHKSQKISGVPQIIHCTHSKNKSQWIPDFSPNNQMYPLNETK
jgi:hypothetical protein